MRPFIALSTAALLMLTVTGCDDRYQDSFQEITCGTKRVLCPPFIATKCRSCPNEDERCLDHTVLEDKGERYTRRMDYSDDISLFSPKEGESYEAYYARMMNTLTLQQYNIEGLEKALEEKGVSLKNLQAQVSTINEQEALMRLTLASYEASDGTTIGKNKKKKRHSPSARPFEKYVVQKGDTLQRISQNAYGTYTGWLAIYRFNLKKMRFGPNRLETGTVLYIPNVDLVDLSHPNKDPLTADEI